MLRVVERAPEFRKIQRAVGVQMQERLTSGPRPCTPEPRGR